MNQIHIGLEEADTNFWRRNRQVWMLVLGLLILGASSTASTVGSGELDPATAEDAAMAEESTVTTWSDVEKLRTDGKYRAALDGVQTLRQAAQDVGDAAGWTRGLIQEAQLTIGLQSFETAVEQLRQHPWPDEARYRAVLELVHAHTLMRYTQMNSWEIRQRERIAVPDGDLGIDQMTAEQIYQEAIAAYARAWNQRESWGAESLGEFAEYIEQNNYPARIRGTFRDAVSYLWVELLADTSNWTPTENNELWRLDVSDLLAEAGDSDVDWTDPSVHPLQKLVAVLGDLEAWHLDAGRQEAAFEARLERLRRVSASLSEDAATSAIQADLKTRLEALSSGLPWHAMGRYELARLLQRQNDLVAAREIAQAGALAHPKSLGGQLCQALVDSIEAPSFDLQSMELDGPDQRSVLIQHKNQPFLYLRAYRLDPLQRLKDPNLKGRALSSRDVQQLVQKGAGDHQWKVDLPSTPDYQQHQTYLTPPMTSPGLYAVVASTRQDFNPNRGTLQAVSLSISDLVIASHTVGSNSKGGWQVTVRSGRTGMPLDDVDVTLYREDWRRGPTKLHGKRTDADGQVRFSKPDDGGRFGYLLATRRGDDATVTRSVARYGWHAPGEEIERALIYTDRSVYRPGQTVQWKVVVYQQDDERRRFQVAPQRQVSMVLSDANGEEVATFEGVTNEFGSLAGSFEIPTGRLLGSWSLRSEPHAYTSLQVEEYKRPTFEVTLQDPAEALRLNAPAKLQGEVRYYFGLPVSEGKADWRVIRQPVYPPWWGWYFRPMPGSSQTVAAGTSALTVDGTFDVEFLPEVAAADEDASRNGVTYRYRVEVDVTNEGGETRSAQRSFRLGHVAVEARVDDARAFFETGDAIRMSVQRQDLDGLPREGTGSWQLLRVEQPETAPLPAEQPALRPSSGDGEPDFQTAGDGLRPRWSDSLPWRQLTASWQDGKELRRGEVRHGADGLGEIETRSLKSGLYRLRYTTEDPYGQTFTTHHDFIVAGEGCDDVRLPLLLLADRATADVGDTVRVLIYSGLEDQQVAWRLDAGEGHRDQGVLLSDRGMQFLEVPVDAAMRGDFALRAEMVRDHQAVSQQARVDVPWSDRELTFELATFRDLLRPGQDETWKVVLRAEDGKALDEGAAELLAYMYDRSLDLFASHRPPHPLDLYPRGVVSPASDFNLGSSRPIWRRGPHAQQGRTTPILHGDRLKFREEYGIGGPGRRGPMMKMRAMPQAAMAMESMSADAMADGAPAAPSPPPSPPARTEAGTSADLEAAAYDGDGAPEPQSEGGEAAPQVRSDFSETAFWHPQLRLESDGAVSFSFQVPDSVTEWNVWLHAMTKDLRSARRQETVRTVKELLVRTYLPRFFRQGDEPQLRVVVDNAGEEDFSGHLDLELFDASTEEDLTAAFGLTPEQIRQVPFEVEAGRSATLTFPVEVPRRLGEVALRVVGKAGDFSDGELRPLPVLPSRLHLAQSRFATLHDRDTANLHFSDMAAGDDPSLEHEQLVVTVDGQLFYSVLHALPYLVTYPYSCSEQTLNRFVSTGIVSSLYGSYPAVARMAEQFSQRETVYEAWGDDDPNRKMLMEETPWLKSSRGGEVAEGAELINVLDPVLAAAQRENALDELRQMQASGGGFPWWSGGPPSPYMTTYILMGLSRALEFGVEVPQDMVQSAWQYLHQHFRRDMVDDLVNGKCCVELATYLNFVLSSYPDLSWTGGVWTDDDRRHMLEASWKNWRKLSPLLKGYLTLTLSRQGREDDARLVWDSVMDSARTDEVQGTFWAPEERAWFWYNDTIEGHAFALRVLQELDPEDPRRHGLVQWLFLNKKLNHWKSTRATAEVLYSLVHYLRSEGGVAQREEVAVRLGDLERQFVFEPDAYTGRKNQWRLDGPEIEAPAMATVTVEKETPGFLFASATWHYATDRLPAEARGDLFHVERTYFLRRHDGDAWQLEPLVDGVEVRPGDQVEVHLTLRAQHAAEYVHLRDPRGAGFEPVDLTSGYRWDLGLGHYREIRDSGTNFFIEWLPAGEYVLKYRLRAALGGTFRIAPATVQSMYAPELVGFSAGHRLEVDGTSP